MIWIVPAVVFALVIFLKVMELRHHFRRSMERSFVAELQRVRVELDRIAPSRGQLRSSLIGLQPGERVINIPQVGGQRKPQVPSRACGHWPRDEVKLNDGTTVAYICRRCGHDWADDRWVAMKDVEWL